MGVFNVKLFQIIKWGFVPICNFSLQKLFFMLVMKLWGAKKIIEFLLVVFLSTESFFAFTYATSRSINADIGEAKIYYPGGDIMNPDGTLFRSDGSVAYPDGTIIDANGTTHYTDGSIKLANGTIYFSNGVIQYPSGLRISPSGEKIDETINKTSETNTGDTTNAANVETDLTKLNQDDGVWDYDPDAGTYKFKILDANGNMLRIYYNCWINKKNDKGKDSWYAVDEDGNMIVGFAKYNGDFYYFSPKSSSKGELVIGETIIGGRTYVFDENGALKKGEVTVKKFPVIGKKNYVSRVHGYWTRTKIDKKSFLLYKEVPGVLRATEPATGWMLIDGYYYCLDEEGIPKTGLTIFDDKYYYLEKDGRMLEGGTVYIDGQTYTFDKATGACLSIT